MKRTTLIVTIMIAVLWGIAPSANAKDSTEAGPAQFVTLISNVIVDGDVVRLGDMFQGAGPYADRVVAYAPHPGARAVYDAHWLARVARAFKLDWRPTSRAERVIVERASQVITKSDVEKLLNRQLIAQGGDANARAVLSNRAFRLHLPLNMDANLSIDQLTQNPSTGNFSATLVWGMGAQKRMRLTGDIEMMTDVPVLSEHVRRGDVIDKHDLEWVRRSQSSLPRDVVTEPDDVVGMSAKRTLQPGRPIVASDLRRPLLVNRGEAVTMTLTTPAMQLTAKGRALQAGSQGDSIRISNLQTNTVVDAVVTGPGQARVETIVNLAMR